MAKVQSVIRFPNSLCLTWKHPGRTCGCKWSLLKVREGKYKRAWRDQVEVGSRERNFFFPEAFKTYARLGAGDSRL
jgi:hypothetical protein